MIETEFAGRFKFKIKKFLVCFKLLIYIHVSISSLKRTKNFLLTFNLNLPANYVSITVWIYLFSIYQISFLFTISDSSCSIRILRWSCVVTISLQASLGTDTSILITWLAPRVGKMNQIVRSDWLSELARWSAGDRTTRCIPQEKFPWKPYNKSFIDKVCLVKMAGYWPHSFFASLRTRLCLGP